MNRINYIRERQNLIEEIPVKEIKYAGSNIISVKSYIFVFPRVIIYESEGEGDATYIFLTKERMECYIAINMAEYFSSGTIRKRADFEKNMNRYSFLFKRIVVKESTEKEWTDSIDFYTNKRIPDVLGIEDHLCFSKALKKYFNKTLTENIKQILNESLPFVNVVNEGKEWKELCFPMFANDKRFEEVKEKTTAFRGWYKDKIINASYSRLNKLSCKIKLCSYDNKFTQSDISLMYNLVKEQI